MQRGILRTKKMKNEQLHGSNPVAIGSEQQTGDKSSDRVSQKKYNSITFQKEIKCTNSEVRMYVRNL